VYNGTVVIRLVHSVRLLVVLRCLPRSPGPSSPSTAESRPTKTPTMGGHDLTFSRAQAALPLRAESPRRGWAEAIHVYTARPAIL